MRLWSIHPKYLDSKGLVALWREALLAKKSLQGKTKAYRNHPQTKRFESYPLKYINTYLYYIYKDSCRREYCFDRKKINKPFTKRKISITKGQLDYEFKHLKRKLKLRHKEKYKELLKVKKIQTNPLFRVKKGKVEDWEKVKNN